MAVHATARHIRSTDASTTNSSGTQNRVQAGTKYDVNAPQSVMAAAFGQNGGLLAAEGIGLAAAGIIFGGVINKFTKDSSGKGAFERKRDNVLEKGKDTYRSLRGFFTRDVSSPLGDEASHESSHGDNHVIQDSGSHQTFNNETHVGSPSHNIGSSIAHETTEVKPGILGRIGGALGLGVIVGDITHGKYRKAAVDFGQITFSITKISLYYLTNMLQNKRLSLSFCQITNHW